MICTRTLHSPLGNMTAASDGHALTGLWFADQKYYPPGAENWKKQASHPVFVTLQTWLTGYFAGKNIPLEIPLNPQGTPFQEMVWKILLQIPYGQLTTYGAIAKQIASMKGLAAISAQAVGGAVGHNPISILVPCHRVVGANNSLTGYAGGLEKKKALLQLERVDLA